jgi:hypothetical protein
VYRFAAPDGAEGEQPAKGRVTYSTQPQSELVSLTEADEESTERPFFGPKSVLILRNIWKGGHDGKVGDNAAERANRSDPPGSLRRGLFSSDASDPGSNLETGAGHRDAARDAACHEATQGGSGSNSATGTSAARPSPQKRLRDGRKPRAPRGDSARLIEEMLESIAPRAARPAEIRSTLQSEKGVSLAFTSIRHALGQLEARRVVEQVADSKTWRHLG